MKRQRNLYEKLISDENLTRAIEEVNATHRWYPRHRPNKTTLWVESDIPARVVELRAYIEKLLSGEEQLHEPTKRLRYDKSAGKWRDICEPRLYPDQYVHHAIIQVLEPVMMRGMDRYCCGSIKGRGIHYGAAAIKRWMGKDVKGTKYCLQLDIRHFYDSIKPEVVVARMKQLIKDRRVLALVERVVAHGVLIGVYCSQWFANTILQPLDTLIHDSRWGVTHYLRYMDNFTIFGANKRKLKKLFARIKLWLAGIGLEVKDDWQLYKTEERQPVALGYRYGHKYTLPRKRNLLRLKRQLANYYRRADTGKPVPVTMACGLLSRIGQLKHCNSVWFYEKYVRPKTQRALKEIVRLNTRKEYKQWITYLAIYQQTA